MLMARTAGTITGLCQWRCAGHGAKGDPMDVSVRLDGANQSGQLRSLALWLTAERELRGRVRTVEPPPEEGTLGPVVQEVLIAVAQGGIGAFVAALVGWIRQRGVDITCSVTTSTGITVEVSTSRVRAAGTRGARRTHQQRDHRGLRPLRSVGRLRRDGRQGETLGRRPAAAAERRGLQPRPGPLGRVQPGQAADRRGERHRGHRDLDRRGRAVRHRVHRPRRRRAHRRLQQGTARGSPPSASTARCGSGPPTRPS